MNYWQKKELQVGLCYVKMSVLSDSLSRYIGHSAQGWNSKLLISNQRTRYRDFDFPASQNVEFGAVP
jgi:hypothetical protein